ncbi:hypothetical protein BGL36_04390 [Fructilactobacillus lindneri]|uniref:mucin-binding protein n=1 Tax=Fructilactobacillus lindneri TaxID=53444 RepID=UPI000CD3FBC1|nr:MucBP domain-containing protein [Fructilactobacillus lindneri]POH06673.1 hypothetical protein BGL36_04390 [Fructilactobacillus lindneri]
MFNSENKTHYKMYKAGKRWLFGAITVTTFTAGIVGGTLLSNGKSVHADTAISTTQSQNTTSTTSDSATDKAQDSNVQANETKTAPVISPSSEDTKAATSNKNDQKAATTQADATQDQSKSAVSTPEQNNDTNNNQAKVSADDSSKSTDQNKTDDAKQQEDTTSATPKDDDSKAVEADSSKQNTETKTADQNQAANTDQAKSTSNQSQADDSPVDQNKAVDAKAATDQNSDDKNTDQNKSDNADQQNQVVEPDKTADADVNSNNQTQNAADNQVAPENDAQKAAEDANQSQTQAAETNLAVDATDPLKVTFTDPDYASAGVPWTDPDAQHYTFGYYDVNRGNGEQSKVKSIIVSTDRNGDGIVYYYELDANNNVLDTIVLNNPGSSYDSKNITNLVYSKWDKENVGFYFPDDVENDSKTGNPDGYYFYKGWTYDSPEKNFDTKFGQTSTFVPEKVMQKITWINKNTNEVMAEHSYEGMAGQHYDVTGMPPEIPTTYYISTKPANASGTVSNFGVPGTKWTKHYKQSYSMTYTETDDHGGMDVQLFDANGQPVKSATWDPTANNGKGGLVAYNGPTTIHIDANYQFDPTTSQYTWVITNGPGFGNYTLGSIYVPQSRNIVFEVAPLGKLVPVDKDGNPIDSGSHDEPYQIDPNDPTKAQQPTIPDIPGYVPIDPNNPSKVLTPGDPSPVTVDDPGKDTTIPYVIDKQTATITYVDQDGNKVLHTDDLDGKIGEHKDYSTKDELATLEKDGYSLVSSDVPNNGITLDYNSGKPLTYTVVVKRVSEPVSEKGTGSLTIHYQYADGQPVLKDANGNTVTDVTKQITFHRDGTKNDETGETTWGDWIPDDGQDINVSSNSPVVTGYYADQKTASGHVIEGSNQTKLVIYNKLGNLIPEVPGGTPVPYPNDPDDPTKAGEPITPDYPGYTPLDPNGNPIKPGTPYPINPNDPGKDTPVPYVANAEQAHVNYVDQDNNDSVIKSDTLDGKFGTKSDYSTKDEIAALEAQGYELVTDGYPGDYTFTTDDPTFTVVLKHKHKTVNPDDPGKPGQPVDPNNPDGPKYPDGTGEQDLVKNITRTIHYQYADGTEASKDVTEQVKYTREITFDEVTGKIIETGKWTSTNPNYAAVDSPAIAGFTPDQAVVGQAATTADDSDSNVTVTYHANAEQAHVNYVDQDNNDSIIKSDTLDGKFGTKSDYSTKDEIAALEARGYELVTDGYPGDYTFTTDDPTFTVVLKHKHKTVNPDDPGKPGQPVDPNNPDGPKYPDGTGEQDLVKNITRTIHYQYADGTEASKYVTEQVKYTREITFDEVTGKIIETGKWTSTDSNYAAVDSPAIAGFTPDQAVVGQAATTADDSDSNVTVTYHANAEQAHVNYVDQDNNDSVIKSDTLDGKFGTKSDYSTKDEIAALEAQGYELVTDGYPGDYTFTTDDPTFTVVLKHKTSSVTPDNPGTPGQPVDPDNPTGPKYPDGTGEKDLVKDITRTIHYKDYQGNTVAKDVVESTKFGRDATFDEVTGKIISYGNWTPVNDTFSAVNSPVINGYYTDTPKVGAETVNADASNSEVTVLYHALGHLVPDVPGSTPIIYPNNPDNPSEAGNPLIPDIPGYTPVDKNGNKLTPGTPYPIDHDHLGEDTPIHYVKNEEPATPVTPSTPETPAQPAEQPSAPVAPVQPETPEEPAAPAPEAPKAEAPQAPAQAETPAPAAKTAEEPKKAALPQTGQDATGSLMSIIGAILLSILGFFGLDGFRKKKEDK